MSHPPGLPDDGDVASLGIALRLLMNEHSLEPNAAAALLVEIAHELDVNTYDMAESIARDAVRGRPLKSVIADLLARDPQLRE
jgi:hypothetical protein